MKTGPAIPPAVTRAAITVLGSIIILFLAVKGITRGRLLLLVALAGIPAAIFFLSRMGMWVVAIFALHYTWIYIPGLPQSLSLFHVMMAGVVPLLAVSRLINRPSFTKSKWLTFWALAFTVVLFVTMVHRGFGLRMFGGESWGGAAYVHLLIGIAFFLTHDSIALTARQWRWAVGLMFLGAMVPSIAELTFLLSKGNIHWLYYFIRPEGASASINLNAMFTGGLVRFQASKYVSYIFLFSMAIFPFRGKYRTAIFLCCALAFVFGGLSGHRSTIVYLLLFIPIAAYTLTRRFPIRLLIAYGIGGVVLTLFLHFAGTSLPLSFQRAFSWVPFAELSGEAIYSAQGTTTWRFEIWKRLLEMAPEYWLVGRGFAFDPGLLNAIRNVTVGDIEWALVTHNYHSGPLTLLIDLGAFGLLSMVLFVIFSTVRFWRLSRSRWSDAGLQRIFSVVLAAYMVNIILFFVVYGDTAYLVTIFLFATFLEGVWKTVRKQADEKDQEEADAAAAPDSERREPLSPASVLYSEGHLPLHR